MPFDGTSRFEIVKKLGAGSFGTVLEVVDHELGKNVALKTLDKVDSDSLIRFKQEFRSLAGFRHSNVAALHELLLEDDRWFYTMELIQGSELLEYLARQEIIRSFEGTALAPPGHLSPAYLLDIRAALVQLADAVSAIHDFGKLHRDIKPSNIVVTDEGRVVLLDFGLVREIKQRDFDETFSLVGTPGYMSPEQISGEKLSEASDWYAFGVVLYQALTGSLPFDGSFFEIAVAQRTTTAKAPGEVVLGIPPELDALSRRLLSLEPAERPAGDEARSILAPPGLTYWLPSIRSRRLGRDQPFLGRESDLAKLQEVLEDVRGGATRAVFLRASSGVGKTALVNEFLDRARIGTELNVFAARCHGRETFEYRALDGVIDSVARLFTKGVPTPADLTADELAAAREAFPIMREVANLQAASPAVADRKGNESLTAFFFKLLSHLTARRPTIVFIDDAQWGDFESGRLLTMLLRHRLPRVMLILAYTAQDAPTSLLLQTFRPEPNETRTVMDLEPVSNEEARAFVLSRLQKTEESPAVAGRIVTEADGNFFFLEELTAHARSGHAEEAPISFANVFRDRCSKLPPKAWSLLKFVSAEGGPVEVEWACEQSGIQRGDDELSLLRHDRWIRSRFTGALEEIEIYHDRIRAAIEAAALAEREAAATVAT